MTNSSFNSYSKSSLDQRLSPSWWQQTSIRFKTTVLAIAIGTIPTIAVGSVAYHFATKSVAQESTSLRKILVNDLQNQVNIFMSDRFNDVKVMANLDIFTNPKLSNIASIQDKNGALEKFQAAHNEYNSIGIFDIEGNVIAQTGSKPLGNHLDRGYVQAALKADSAVISQPRISTSSGTYSIYTASPIKDKYTGQTIGFVRARIPVAVLRDLLRDFTSDGSKYYLLNDRGEIFLGSSEEYVIKTNSDNSQVTNKTFDYEAIKANKFFQGADELFSSKNVATNTAKNLKANQQQFLAFAPTKNYKDLPALNWQALIATDTSIVFAPQRSLRWIFLLGTGVVAIGVAAIAYSITERILRPILVAADAVEEIGQGNFDVKLEITGTDEIAQLGRNINNMSEQLLDFVNTQTMLAQQSEVITNATLMFATAETPFKILQIGVNQSYKVLPVNRVVYYQFDSDQTGIVVAESVAQGFIATQNTDILHPDLISTYFNDHQEGNTQIKIINNLAEVDPLNREKLISLEVKASLIAPVLVENRLDGLLIAHQCSEQHIWLNEEIEFVTRIANQIGFAITRLEFLAQQKQGEIREKAAKEAIQNSASKLLQEVYDLSTGDLTIRAKVTEDEIGIIADSYNSTIESLQKLVEQTKTAAVEVQANTLNNDLAVKKLTQEAVTQADEIAQMLAQVRAMTRSSHQVVLNASQADSFIQQANLTILKSDQAMNQTVAEISAVKNVVSETATKAERLGVSSQEISQAVNLIGRFAAQTHLLALKASIEAARAGAQGKGFAVIADEVRSLATQSAEATTEIETLVNKIQLETGILVNSMNQSTEQIALGNELVQTSRQNLTEVSQVSNELSKLVNSITQAARIQSETSTQVSQTMVNVAAIAENNSESANQVSDSIKQLTAVAERLQSNIGKFKT